MESIPAIISPFSRNISELSFLTRSWIMLFIFTSYRAILAITLLGGTYILNPNVSIATLAVLLAYLVFALLACLASVRRHPSYILQASLYTVVDVIYLLLLLTFWGES